MRKGISNIFELSANYCYFECFTQKCLTCLPRNPIPKHHSILQFHGLERKIHAYENSTNNERKHN